MHLQYNYILKFKKGNKIIKLILWVIKINITILKEIYHKIEVIIYKIYNILSNNIIR